MLSKKIVIVLIVVVVVLVALGVWLGTKLLSTSQQSPSGPSDYSAVYMATGDIYYGKLYWLPSPHLKNVWFLQRGLNAQNQTQLSLAPLTSAFWGPVDEVYLNPQQIIFWTRLRNDSQVAKAFGNPLLFQQAAQPSVPAATSTFRGPSGPPPGNP